MSPRVQAPMLADVGAADGKRHAPLPGDEYEVAPVVSPDPADGRRGPADISDGARRPSDSERLREIERISNYDTPVKPSVFQLSVPGAGKVLELPAKLWFRLIKGAVGKVVTRHDQTRAAQRTRREEAQRNDRRLRDAIDHHFVDRRDRRQQDREQTGLDRRDHRRRIGDPTMIA